MFSELRNKRICVTGGGGFLGRAVCTRLKTVGVHDVFVPRRRDFDLTCSADVDRLFEESKPEVIIHLAAEVGGIGANERNPGRYFYANMAMGLHLIEGSRKHGTERFVQVATVCAYPKFCPVPFKEADLWSGYPEETNAAYGVAKRSLAVMLDAYRKQYGFNGVYLIPANLYGPHDNFDLETSHVVPAMIRRFCEAMETGSESVTCWGTGQATREFLYIDDAADAVVRAAAMLNESDPINIGTGREISICDLSDLIAKLTGFRGRIEWDIRRADGQPRRMIDTRKAEKLLAWTASTSFDQGLKRTISWWREQRSRVAPVARVAISK
jgi:GDP-L-fucose synthase